MDGKFQKGERASLDGRNLRLLNNIPHISHHRRGRLKNNDVNSLLNNLQSSIQKNLYGTFSGTE